MLVSIIIPVYKVEQYIGRCVESVLNQTYRQLEVILVDDCTPDQSIQIAKDLIEDSEKSGDLVFKYLTHEHNRGLSAARNTGLDAASGSYVYFLDSDDEITPECIETLVDATSEDSVDVVCGALELFGAVESFSIELSFYDALYMGNAHVINAFVKDRIPIAAWNKLIRRDVLISEKLYFKEGLIYEDNLWTFELAHSVDSIKTITKKTYHYRIRSSSIMTSTHYIQKYDYMLIVFAEREKFIKERAKNNRVTRNYLIKNKAIWIQCRMCDEHIPFSDRWRLASTALNLCDKYAVLGYSILYYMRWVSHQIKCIVCH
jgi:glycosyltransferase involved in cell wall biosynthesis